MTRTSFNGDSRQLSAIAASTERNGAPTEPSGASTELSGASISDSCQLLVIAVSYER